MAIKWQSYAALQLSLGADIEAPVERIVYAVTAYMDSIGMMPCDSGSAERTVAFVDTSRGFTVYDDQAERHDIKALDGLGVCLSGKFRTSAIGVVGAKNSKMLRLFLNGKRRDVFCSSKDIIDGISCQARCGAQAKRWQSVIKKGYSVEKLSDAFLKCKDDCSGGYGELKKILSLDDTLNFGFSSIEYAELKGVITLYFCAANRVRQNLVERFIGSSKDKRRLVGNAIKGKFYHYSWGY